MNRLGLQLISVPLFLGATLAAAVPDRSDYVANLDILTIFAQGSWTPANFCPEGSWASGFRLQVEPPQGGGQADDTAVNAVELICRTRNGAYAGTVQTTPGFGNWGQMRECTSVGSFLTNVIHMVDPTNGPGDNDDTAVVDMSFACAGSSVWVNSDNGIRGWGTWQAQKSCPANTRICGIQARVDNDNGPGLHGSDDRGLVAASINCCTF